MNSQTEGSGLRCITINAYSPRTIVTANELIGNRTSTGILVGQFSHAVTIEGNRFRGSFGQGADVKVQGLSQAQIRGNRFLTSTMINIVCDLGGAATIQNNEFAAPTAVSGQRPLRIYTIEANEAGKGAYGNAAGLLPGIIFQRNVIKNRPMGVQITQQTASNGNSPGLRFCIVRDNTFENMDLANGTEEYGLFVETTRSIHRVSFSYFNNRFLPRARPDRNTAKDVGGFGVNLGRRETTP